MQFGAVDAEVNCEMKAGRFARQEYSITMDFANVYIDKNDKLHLVWQSLLLLD